MGIEDMSILSLIERARQSEARITSIEEIRAEIARPKLGGLKRGDLLVQIPDSTGYYASRSEDKPVVFVRYLTEGEHNTVIAKGDAGEMFLDVDCLICYYIKGFPVCFTADSARYRRY